MSLRVIHTKNINWVDIINPEDSDILYLKDNFRFHPLDIEDVVMPSARTKIDEYDDYCFVILVFPILNKETGEIQPAEVDFFIGKNFLVTIHDGSMKTLANLVKNISQFDNVRAQYMSQSPGFLLYSILELLFKRSFPILAKLNAAIQTASQDAFELHIQTLQKLSQMKRNIIVYRRIMKMHKFVLSKLARQRREYVMFRDSKLYFQNLIEITENIWDMLSSDKESIESFEQTNQSLAGHHMHDILRILTVFSVIIFLLTLLINVLLFVGTVSHIDSWPLLLPSTCISLLIVTIIMLIYFKNRKWL
jgi:magnesium transporter